MNVKLFGERERERETNHYGLYYAIFSTLLLPIKFYLYYSHEIAPVNNPLLDRTSSNSLLLSNRHFFLYITVTKLMNVKLFGERERKTNHYGLYYAIFSTLLLPIKFYLYYSHEIACSILLFSTLDCLKSFSF